ncbi:pyridoxamine 5'-phosphate oxidase family protein [Rubrobacter indicoceani]|uniref:pyridoxamine 5'-phosphate oxidase family protein n=1 Tax=Rubrobacter indicoceani TaxID=2051957 RepID=UPI000E5C3E01|nr:pyridoxamine 5'-phosphate oxidase family protein [Rubrobacter indicoceani]
MEIRDGASEDLLRSAETAAVAELAYRDRDGRISARPVTPVVLDGRPAFTLTYAEAELAEHLERNPEACLSFTDSRLARVGWRPLGVSGRLSVVPDIEGELFCEELIHQELVKFPPGRKLSNSLILRRENWWYVPRFILKLEAAGEAVPLIRRQPQRDHAVLFWREVGGVSCDVVAADYRGEPDFVSVSSLTGRVLPGSGEAVIYACDFSVPDLEHRVSFRASGRLRGGRLAVESREGERNLGNPPGILARWREFRSLEQRCRAGIEARERSL